MGLQQSSTGNGVAAVSTGGYMDARPMDENATAENFDSLLLRTFNTAADLWQAQALLAADSQHGSMDIGVEPAAKRVRSTSIRDTDGDAALEDAAMRLAERFKAVLHGKSAVVGAEVIRPHTSDAAG